MKNILMVLTVFLFLTSCHTFVNISSPQEYATFQEKRQVYVLSVRTHFNEKVYFSKRFPGRIAGTEITGIHQVPIFQFDPDTVIYRHNRNTSPAYAFKDGIRYEVVRHDSMNLLYNPYTLIHVPLSDIQHIHLKTSKPGSSALFITSVSAGLVGAFIWIISSASLNAAQL